MSASVDAAPCYVYAPYTKRASKIVSAYWVDRYEQEAVRNWDLFYQRHSDHFFKDRHYLEQEWPELRANADEEEDGDGGTNNDGDDDGGDVVGALLAGASGEGELIMLEAGCGVGNTLFPLLRSNSQLRAYGVECSKTAVDIVRRHPLAQAGRVVAAVGDLTSGALPPELGACIGQCHVATLMFVLSAISPGATMTAAIAATASALREGGRMLIRDYAQGDGAQKRLQAATRPKQLDDAGRFFVRQDGTRAYYFELEELSRLVEAHGFVTERCEVTCRETVNRAKGLAIARRYVTATFVKVGGGGGGAAAAARVAPAAAAATASGQPSSLPHARTHAVQLSPPPPPPVDASEPSAPLDVLIRAASATQPASERASERAEERGANRVMAPSDWEAAKRKLRRLLGEELGGALPLPEQRRMLTEILSELDMEVMEHQGRPSLS